MQKQPSQSQRRQALFATASTPESFDALVQKIEAIAQKNPTYYRRRLRLLASLGYGYIILVFALILGGLVLLRQVITMTQGSAIASQLNLIMLIIAVGFLSLFFVPVKKPAGVPLTRAQVPQLFAMLDELSTALKAPKLHTVILNAELNAAVMQRPKFGIIGWHTNYLLLGLPLMQILSPEQFKAVLAHELAHLCGGDGRVAAWIYRIRKTWFELAERFEQNRQGGVFFRKFFSWYGPFFKAYSFVHARSQEYEADRRAAELVGAQNKAEALIWLNINASKLVKQVLPRFEQRAAKLAEPPDDYVSSMMATLEEEISLEEQKKWLSAHLARQSTNESTHPCLSDRLNALGYKIPEQLSQNQESATVLIKDQLHSAVKQLDQLWKKEHLQVWHLLRDRYQHRQQRLKALEAKPQDLLTIEERIKQATLHYAIGDKSRVYSIVNSVLKEDPNHAAANYWMGALLTEGADNKNREQGIAHLQQSTADPSFATAAYRQLYIFHTQQQQVEQAERCQRELRSHEKEWTLALKERTNPDASTQFSPHNLPAAEVQQLTEFFSSYKEVKAVYVARQKMARFESHDYYVFAIARRYYRGMSEEYRPDGQLLQVLEDAIALSQDHTIHILNPSQQWLSLRQTKDACLYQLT